jgi:flagellar motor switch protein FliG
MNNTVLQTTELQENVPAPLTKMQKVAIVLCSLGSEQASQVLNHLDEKLARQISSEFSKTNALPESAKRAVIREFRIMAGEQDEWSSSADFTRKVLTRAFGLEYAQNILNEHPPVNVPTKTLLLTTLSAERAAELLEGEPPRIISLLLVTLPAGQAAAILAALPVETQPVVARQLTKTSMPAPEVQVQLEKALRIKSVRHTRDEAMNGRAILAEITRSSSANKTVKEIEPGFYDLRSLSGYNLSEALAEVAVEDLADALRGSDEELSEYLKARLPEVKRTAVEIMMEELRPITLRTITAAQTRVVRQITNWKTNQDRESRTEPAYV